jgi:hypothetical protein
MGRVPSLTQKHLHPFEMQEIINLYNQGIPAKVLCINFNICERRMTEILKGNKHEHK